MFEFPFYAFSFLYVLLYSLPGIILTITWKRFKVWERILLGILVGFPLPALFSMPFLILNISYSPIFPLILELAFLAFWVWHFREEYKSLDLSLNIRKEHILPTFFIVFLFLNLLIRLQSFSPIYSELDPYYYLYTAKMLLSLGYVPYFDDTAWYPYTPSTHRVVPGYTATIAFLYPFLFQGVDIYNLSSLANMFPPLLSVLTAVALYFLLSQYTGRELSIILSSSILTFPSFIVKFMSGVFEVQPFAFFSLSFSLFSLIYLWKEGVKRESLLLLSISIPYLILSNVSHSLILYSTILYSFLLIFLFLNNPQEEHWKKLKMVALSFILGYLLLSAYRLSLEWKYLLLSALLPVPPYVHWVLSKRFSKETLPLLYAFGFLLALGFFFSPFGKPFYDLIRHYVAVAEYENPLEWTIAEQNLAPSDFTGAIGGLGSNLPVIRFLFSFLTMIYNLFLSATSSLLNIVFSLRIPEVNKSPGIYSFFLLGGLFTFFYLLWKIYREGKYEEYMLPLLFSISILIVSAYKVKFYIYFAYAFFLSSSIFLSYFYNLFMEKWPSKKLWYMAFVFLFFFSPNAFSSFYLSMAKLSMIPKPSFDPEFYATELNFLCSQGLEKACMPLQSIEKWDNHIEDQFGNDICLLPIYYKFYRDNFSFAERSALGYKCSSLPDYWVSAMRFLRENTEEDARILSWWDYGHWTNYFGNRKAVLRNEHSNLTMILKVAYAYVMGNESFLKEIMKEYNASYVLIDREILMSGNGFGGKFGALDYLACSYINQSSLALGPGASECEYLNRWETLQISPQESCIISPVTGKKGVIAYRLEANNSTVPVSLARIRAYCAGEVELSDGRKVLGIYLLNETNEVGELRLQKGFLIPIDRENNVYQVLYTKDPVWLVNGTSVSGWEDRTKRFYDSVIYKGFVLGELEGFVKVYDNGDVKIYKLVS